MCFHKYKTILPVVMGLEPEIGDNSWYSISSCFIWKKSGVAPVEGDEIKMEDVAEVGVLGNVEVRGIILPFQGSTQSQH